MILETEEEKNAFEFVCELASERCNLRGCNDLSQEDMKKFKGMMVDREDEGEIFKDKVKFDFDIIFWIENKAKEKI